MALILGILSTCLLSLCILIHIKCHFAFNTPRHDQKSLSLYPSLWTLYLCFLFMLSIAIIASQFNDKTNEFIKWIICYGIILSSLFESFLSFHRYCTLRQYTHHNHHRIGTKHIVQKFAWFASCYLMLFVLELHFIYWLFPFILILYISFNLFWQYRFIQMLILSYVHICNFKSVTESLKEILLEKSFSEGFKSSTRLYSQHKRKFCGVRTLDLPGSNPIANSVVL